MEGGGDGDEVGADMGVIGWDGVVKVVMKDWTR